MSTPSTSPPARTRQTGSRRRRFLLDLARVSGALGVLGAVVSVLGGRRGSGARVACVRPPGALEEEEFLARCIRCGRCADACPNQCIVAFTPASGQDLDMAPGSGQHGTPVIFPRSQACMLCNRVPGDHLLCTEACPTGALRLVPKTVEGIVESANMGTSVVDHDLCFSWQGSSCGVCVRACPLEGLALRAGSWERPIVDAQRCVGCGLCERACIRYPTAIQIVPRNANEVQA